MGFLAAAMVWAAQWGGLRCAPGQSAGWADTRRLGPFICHSEFPLDGMEPLGGQLRQLQADLIQTLRLPGAAEPVELYLFREKASYDRFVRRYFPQVVYRRALYIRHGGPGMVMAYCGPHFETDLRHECTHALLHAALPEVPLWLDEGLAKYFEVPQATRQDAHPYLDATRWMVQLGLIPTIEQLETKSDLEEMKDIHYRAAWAWVHFMLHGPEEGRTELIRYLADLRSGEPPGSLAANLRRRMPDLEDRLAAHFRRWRPLRGAGAVGHGLGRGADRISRKLKSGR